MFARASCALQVRNTGEALCEHHSCVSCKSSEHSPGLCLFVTCKVLTGHRRNHVLIVSLSPFPALASRLQLGLYAQCVCAAGGAAYQRRPLHRVREPFDSELPLYLFCLQLVSFADCENCRVYVHSFKKVWPLQPVSLAGSILSMLVTIGVLSVSAFCRAPLARASW